MKKKSGDLSIPNVWVELDQSLNHKEMKNM